MTILEVINSHPYLSLFGLLFFTGIITHFIFLCWNRLLRCLTIRKVGWPPPHCDADGDSTTKAPPKEDE